MKILEKLLLVKEMITQLVVCYYSYFTDSYKIIAVDLSKQHKLDANPRATQQINFTANLDTAGNTRIFYYS